MKLQHRFRERRGSSSVESFHYNPVDKYRIAGKRLRIFECCTIQTSICFCGIPLVIHRNRGSPFRGDLEGIQAQQIMIQSFGIDSNRTARLIELPFTKFEIYLN